MWSSWKYNALPVTLPKQVLVAQSAHETKPYWRCDGGPRRLIGASVGRWVVAQARAYTDNSDASLIVGEEGATLKNTAEIVSMSRESRYV